MNSENDNLTLNEQKELVEFHRDRRKWRIRRRLALISFAFLIIITSFYMIAPAFMPMEQATSTAEFNGVIIALIGFFSSIVIAYVGAVTYSEKTLGGSKTEYK